MSQEQTRSIIERRQSILSSVFAKKTTRRGFLAALGLGSVTAVTAPLLSSCDSSEAATNKVQNILTPKLKPLNEMNSQELAHFSELIRQKLAQAGPKGTRESSIRYFAIGPNTPNVQLADIQIYVGEIKKDANGGEKPYIYANAREKISAFPKAKIVRGSGLGMLIDLEASSQKLIYGMSVPVRSESLPKIEAAPDMEFTFKTNTPPYRALQHDNVIMAGFQYLNNLSKDSVTNFYRSAPQDVREIYFSGKKESIETLYDPRLLQLFAIVEHMDVGTLKLAEDKDFLQKEYLRVLSNYGLNQSEAFRYTKSPTEARGFMQIDPRTFQSYRNRYSTSGIPFGNSHIDCATNPIFSMSLCTLLITEQVGLFISNSKKQSESKIYSGVDYLKWKQNTPDATPHDYFPLVLGAMYNSGTKPLKNKNLYNPGTLHKLDIPAETQIYLRKVQFVWEKLTQIRSKINLQKQDEKKNTVSSKIHRLITKKRRT